MSLRHIFGHKGSRWVYKGSGPLESYIHFLIRYSVIRQMIIYIPVYYLLNIMIMIDVMPILLVDY